MRLGTTSYIIPDDILPNVEYLAPRVDDVELVLFEVDDYGSNLPDDATVARLADLAAAHDLTYTVHLPLDLRLAADGSTASASLDKARRCIARTRALAPWAYVLHLDGQELEGGVGPAELAAWQERAERSLRAVANEVDDPSLLAIENLEHWDPESFAPLLDRLPVSRCVDVGHFWKMGQDPLPALARWLPRARVIHVHGMGERDHQSLALTPPERLDPVVAALAGFGGVVTLEVFGEDDWTSSVAAWRAAEARVVDHG